MATQLSLTFDCERPKELAAFWAEALGYVPAPPPPGFATWEEWLASVEVPPEEWDDGAGLVDPAGVGPRISFLKVPEHKTAKNRVHIDLQVGGGRQTPWEDRWPRVVEMVRQLTGAGASVIREDQLAGRPDHVVMADPEGNEFCVV